MSIHYLAPIVQAILSLGVGQLVFLSQDIVTIVKIILINLKMYFRHQLRILSKAPNIKIDERYLN